MTQETKDTIASLLKDYGFAVTVACALLYTARTDVLIPMVESHREFLKELAETQHEISKAVSEQTKLLYAMQTHHEQTRTVKSVQEN